MSSPFSSLPNEGSSRKRKDQDEETNDKEETPMKKPRVVWTMELHQKFLEAVEHLGIHNAVPLKILKFMKEPELERGNIASHLQKYRAYLKKLCGVAQNQRLPYALLQPSTEAAGGSMSEPSGLELLALASTGQLPVESLATLHASAFSKPATTSPIPKPATEKKKRVGTSNNNKQEKPVSLTVNIPTNMGQGNFRSAQPSWGMNGSSQVKKSIYPFVEMTQLELSGQLLNPNPGPQVPGVWTPNGVVGGLVSQSMRLPGSGFPHTGNSEVTTPAPNPGIVMSSWRRPGPVWSTQNVGSTSHASQPVVPQGAGVQPMASQGVCVQPMASQGAWMPGPVWCTQNVGSNAHASQPMVPQGAGVQPMASQGVCVQPMASPGAWRSGPVWCTQNVGSTSHVSQPMALQGAGAQLMVSQGVCVQPLASQRAFTQPLASHAVCVQPMASQGAWAQPGFSTPPLNGNQKNILVGGGQDNTVSMDPVNPALASTSRAAENQTDPGCQSNLFSESFTNEDMMTMLMEQMQYQDEAIPDDNLGYNGYY